MPTLAQPRTATRRPTLVGARAPRLANDARLVTLVDEGRDDAFEEIVRRYRRPLLVHARRILGDGRAEDALQQALMNAYGALRAGRGPDHLQAWLHRLTRNAAVDVTRRAPEAGVPLDETVPGADTPETAVLQRERLAEVLRVLEALPASQRDALILRELEGASHAAIADRLEISAPAARQLVHRARVRLRDGAAVVVLTPGLLARMVREASAHISVKAAAVVVGGTLAVGGPVVVGHATRTEPVWPATAAGHAAPLATPPADAAAAGPRATLADRAGPASRTHVTRRTDAAPLPATTATDTAPQGDDRDRTSGTVSPSTVPSASQQTPVTRAATAPAAPADQRDAGSRDAESPATEDPAPAETPDAAPAEDEPAGDAAAPAEPLDG